MRGNGLTAESYTAVSEVGRTHAGDALLVLREIGVAAYVVLDDDGRVQVFADRDAVPQARQALRDLATEPIAVDDAPARGNHDAPARGTDDGTDDAWAQIVAGYDETAPEPTSRSGTGWTPPPSTPEPETERPPDPPRARPRPPEGRPTEGLNTEATWDDEGHFVPPDPPPVLPPRDLVSKLAWGGLIGGPLLMLLAVVFGFGLPTEVLMVCALGFVGGLVTLILRMRDRGDGSDGAVL